MDNKNNDLSVVGFKIPKFLEKALKIRKGVNR